MQALGETVEPLRDDRGLEAVGGGSIELIEIAIAQVSERQQIVRDADARVEAAVVDLRGLVLELEHARLAAIPVRGTRRRRRHAAAAVEKRRHLARQIAA